MIGEGGAAEVGEGAASEFWQRTGAEPAVDVNMLTAGEPRTVIPSRARAQLSIRLAPGQSAAGVAAAASPVLRGAAPGAGEVAAAADGLRRAAVPDAAELSTHFDLAEPSLFHAGAQALQLAAGAF